MTEDRTRSTDPNDYQELPQSVGAMSKWFEDGFEISLHHHARDQLLFARQGVMGLMTARDAWILPQNSAAYIPAGLPHAVKMHGEVDMRTLYIDQQDETRSFETARILSVTPLLRELILSLSEEPVDYEPGSRAAQIAGLIEIEIQRAGSMVVNVPLPTDPRLQRVCARLLADPSDRRTLEGWADVALASPRTLARLFDKDLGMSFNQWRQRMRFQQAVEALSSGAPVAIVAQNHGYNSPSAFTVAFKKALGFAPSALGSDKAAEA